MGCAAAESAGSRCPEGASPGGLMPGALWEEEVWMTVVMKVTTGIIKNLLCTPYFAEQVNCVFLAI